MIDMPMGRPFLMVYSARPGRLGASDAIYRRSAKPYVRVDVASTLHLDFTDMNFWGGLLQGHAFGTIGATRASESTRTIVREFFEQALLGRVSPLLSGATRLEGVSVR